MKKIVLSLMIIASISVQVFAVNLDYLKNTLASKTNQQISHFLLKANLACQANNNPQKLENCIKKMNVDFFNYLVNASASNTLSCSPQYDACFPFYRLSCCSKMCYSILPGALGICA